MSLLPYVHEVVTTVLADIPKPGGAEPPAGAEKILSLLRGLKWLAGVSLLVGFFGGLAAWTAGRLVHNRHAGPLGLVMMLTALGGAVLYGLSWTLINSLSQ